MSELIYLDFNASTPIAPEVREKMLPFLEIAFGNPSSRHAEGAPAKAAIEHARGEVASLCGASPDEIVFTSGGSEANNAAIKGAYFAAGKRNARFVTTAVEHPATLNTLRFLEKLGAELVILPVDRTGRVRGEDVEAALREETLLLTVMHANNETGTIQPVLELAELARRRGVLFHVDAAQSAGKISIEDLGCDLLSIAGHKLYAPKGVGVLYQRTGTKLEPLIHGGGHENGRRAGTESALLAVGLGAACTLAKQKLPEMEKVQVLRDKLYAGIKSIAGDRAVLNGHPELRLPNTLNISFVDKIGADILGALGDVAASTGSACHAGSVHLSPVLEAMNVPPHVGMGAIRFSLGHATTEDQIDRVLAKLALSL